MAAEPTDVVSARQAHVRKGDQVRDRGRVLLVLLLALFATAGTAVPETAQAYTAEYRAATPATHHDLRDWLRLPVAGRQAMSTPAPDSWWAVTPQTTCAYGFSGGPSVGEVGTASVAIGVAATPSTRAPPARVS
jgi:hypothetical protein